MRYEVLGPLRVADDGGTLPLSARKMEILLATLIVRAGQVVTLDQLIAEIWNASPPRRATDTLYVYVSQLRKLLGRAGRAGNPIVTAAHGYLLRPHAGETDLHDLQALMRRGRDAVRARRHHEAAALFTEALGLWRGPALGELRAGPIIAGFAGWAGEMRLECREHLVDSSLAAGRHREIVGLLYELVAEHPLHEAFHRQLMLALYRCGRRADALMAYRRARQALRDELGVEPCWDLRDLQRRILRADEPVGAGLAG